MFAVLVHVLTETNRHAGHADILREQLDGRIGVADDDPNSQPRPEFWSDRYATIQRAALAAAAGATDTADGPACATD